ncbi:putative signaling protein [Saliniradius amylolyticus]|uniref:Putative signaling protein n=1 Tax=Saliniradius amylolyticus TaxID=2183582 RepID=A0A2S2E6N2_9ALTE|nr:EAL domain-containing protein [Saliniradius amylolyticus]AWL13315.1 putative signaling protein [Saliniradius amylolyticus]
MRDKDINAADLSIDELRELIPQLQQLTEKYKQSEAIQKALFDISELANSVSDLPRLYPAIHDIISRMMPARNFFVAMYEASAEMVEFVYFVDEFDELTVREMPSSGLMKGFTGHVLRTAEPLFLTKENYEQKRAEIAGSMELGAHPVDWIGVPLKRGSQVMGAMVVQSYDESVRYSEQDLELLVFVSQHIVNAVDRVKSRELTEKTIRQRTRQLREMNEELQEEINERQKIESLQQALFEISELSAGIDGEMSKFYGNIHDILARLISAPNCYIAIHDKDNNSLRFPYFNDEKELNIPPREVGDGLTEFVLRSGNAALIDASYARSLAEQGELSESVASNMSQTGNCWLGSPLIVEGEISGVIAVQTYDETQAYDLKDLELLKFVSHHIATAMERKQAAEAIQEYNQQLSQKVKERTEELRHTNDHLKQQIEERKEIELKLIHDAHHDSLTDLPNRVMFVNRLELAVANKKRHPENHFAVLFIDLDRFKLINDTIGHHAGDMFLVEVANRIGQCIRGHDLLARLGGDEFVILLDSLESEEKAEQVAGRIIKALSQPYVLEGQEMYSGASIGIAIIHRSYNSADEVVRDADAAMYQAKFSGRGRYITFDKSMREKLLEEVELENEFRHLLREEKFECYCQPTVGLYERQWQYIECYVRWHHPTLGRIKRERFWQVAEHSGQAIELDNFMLSQLPALFEALDKDPEREEARVAINLSVNHLLQERLVRQLLKYIEQLGLNPKRLIFELDEQGLSGTSQHILPALKRLQRAGITLVLDNFGSGLASLSYLYSYPFDYVKVDHRFIKTIPASKKNLKMVQSVLSMSEHLGFTLIAEGVKNKDQYEALFNIGCSYGQGAYLGETQPLNQLLAAAPKDTKVKNT